MKKGVGISLPFKYQLCDYNFWPISPTVAKLPIVLQMMLQSQEKLADKCDFPSVNLETLNFGNW